MRRAAFVAILLLLGGCTDALIYGERTSFNLAISINDDPAIPMSVNAGLHRTVVTYAPPLGGNVQRRDGTVIAAGESVAAISKFDLAYEEGKTPLAGKL